MKNSSFALTVLLVAVNILLFLYFIQDQSKRLTSFGSALREELLSEVRKTQAAAVPAEAVQRISNQLDYLQLRQTAILDETRNSIERQATIFTTVAAFFGLFTIFFGYRQLLVDSRGNETREKHDQEMRSLVQSFQNNMNTISSLITALEETFKFRKEIQDELKEVRGRAAELEKYRAETDTVFEASLDDLNQDAVSVVPLAMDRPALNFEENRRRLEAFAAKMDAAERTRNVEGRLNPFCYYVRGLSHATTYQYKLGIGDFEIAARKAKEDVVEPKIKTYALEHRERLPELLADMHVSCSYFQGVCHKNLGNYSDSAKKFREALDRNRQHHESLAYLLQVMFFDEKAPFHDVESEFEKATQEYRARLATADQTEREKLRRASQVLEINYGDIYHRKLLSPDYRSAYKKYENPEKAVLHYWQAHDLFPNELTAFCLAQALENVGSSHWKSTTPEILYATTLTAMKTRVADEDDKLYSVSQYYMLAACAKKLREHFAVAEVFLSQARHSLREVPQDITCFSPISRIRLTRRQIMAEMEEFEKLSQEKMAYAT